MRPARASAAARRPSQVPVGERWGDVFATDLSGVTLHPESSRPSGDVHALTIGDDVHFAPGRYSPGTAAGNWLIAHELAHVVQQRRPGPPTAALAAEAEADAAARDAASGRSPRLQASLPGSVAHAFEAWEHRALGDAYGGQDQKLTLPNGVTLTYGQIVALSGDFYRSPEALLAAPKSELEAVLRVMADERAKAAASPEHRPGADDANKLNVAYQLATTGHDRHGQPIQTLGGDPNAPSGAHGEVREGEHVESGAPGAQASFFDLAAVNPAHFSTDNITLNWIPKHQLALDLARQAWQARNAGKAPAPIAPGTAPSARDVTAKPGDAAAKAPARPADQAPGFEPTPAAAAGQAPGRPDPAAAPTPANTANAQASAAPADQLEAQAWAASGFSDHYLTDAFASGHLISGDRSRTQAYFDANRSAIVSACWQCAMAEGVEPGDAIVITKALEAAVSSNAKNLLLKIVHDYYNRNGIDVQNALGQGWKTFGDAHLGGSPDTIAMGSLASKASRDAVQDVLATGGTNRAQAALDYIPDTARLGPGKPFKPIKEFAVDPYVWDPVLNRSKSPDPAVNDLYQVIKGNVGPIANLYTQEGGRWVRKTAKGMADTVTDTAKRAGHAVAEGASDAARGISNWAGSTARDVKEAPGRLEAEIKRLYGIP